MFNAAPNNLLMSNSEQNWLTPGTKHKGRRRKIWYIPSGILWSVHWLIKQLLHKRMAQESYNMRAGLSINCVGWTADTSFKAMKCTFRTDGMEDQSGKPCQNGESVSQQRWGTKTFPVYPFAILFWHLCPGDPAPIHSCHTLTINH